MRLENGDAMFQSDPFGRNGLQKALSADRLIFVADQSDDLESGFDQPSQHDRADLGGPHINDASVFSIHCHAIKPYSGFILSRTHALLMKNGHGFAFHYSSCDGGKVSKILEGFIPIGKSGKFFPMKKDSQDIVRQYMTACVNKLQETSQTMEDLYNAIITRDPKADCYTYFDENGAPKTRSYEDFANSVFTTASKLSRIFSSIAPGTIVGLKLKNSPRWTMIF
jgi:hypothetical protein